MMNSEGAGATAAACQKQVNRVHRAVQQPVGWQARALARVACGELFVDLDCETGGVSGNVIAVGEGVLAREDLVGLGGVAHALLVPKSGIVRSTGSAAAMATGNRSVAPWKPVLTP